MTTAASFDVFDTLLTRRVALPTSLFHIVGDRAVESGLWQATASEFHKQRIHSEAEARSFATGLEVTLSEIYNRFTESAQLPSATGESLARLEIEVEAELLVPVPGARVYVDIARKASAKVLFLSDMYLPSSFIEGQLVKHGFWRGGDQLYVSGEHKCSKADGRLFTKALFQEKLHPTSVTHTGDRLDSDYKIPLQLGIKARHLDRCYLTRYEKLMEEFSADSIGFTSLLAGISRLTRLETIAKTKHIETISQLASSLVSPIITFYAIWVLREAQKRGIKRLYFVARDGYLIKTITESLICSFGLQVETRYLYGSRQAWHLPAIEDFTKDDLSWLFERTRTLSMKIILNRLQIIPEDIEEILAQLGWPRCDWSRPLDDALLSKLKTDLLSSVRFRAEVENLVVKKRDITLQYFAQEGLLEEVPWALIDLGWHGRLQQSLEKLIGNRRVTRAVGLYFGLFADSPALAHQTTASYLNWDLRCPPDSKDIPSLVFLMESFCTAPHGSTIGYRRSSNGLIVPECRDSGFEPLKTWGVAAVHATVGKYAEKLAELKLARKVLDWDSRPAMVSILGTFSRNPLASEAKAWGAFPYEDEQSGVVRERLTVPYKLTLENLRIALTFGDKQYLPASWDVLWRGAQEHTLSLGNVLLRIALRIGLAKRKLGDNVRRICGLLDR